MSKNWNKFLTMKVLEDTPTVLSLGKLCDEDGYSYEWIKGQKTHLRKNGIRIINATLRTSFRSWFQACQIRLLDLTHQLRGHFHETGESLLQHLLPASSSSPTASEMSVREREDVN